MATTHPQIEYQCPSCEAIISVSSEFVGDQVDCPNCAIPFEANAPEADPMLELGHTGDSAEFSIDQPTDDESVTVELHPAMFRRYPLMFSGLLIIGIAAVFSAVYTLSVGRTTLFYATIPVILTVCGYFIYWYLNVLSIKLTVTNKRTTLRTGLIAKSTTEVQHDDIRNLQVDQSIGQRILGSGDLAISSSGQDDLEVCVKGIPNPNDVADLIRGMQ